MSDKSILINPSEILIQKRARLFKDATFTRTTFTTNKAYLMSNPTGVLRAGGYERCPTFYGSSADPNAGISDKDNGWWPTDLLIGNYAGGLEGLSSGGINIDIPRWDFFKTVIEDFSTPHPSAFWESIDLPILKANSAGGGTVGSAVGGFRWRITLGGGAFNRNISIFPSNVWLLSRNISGFITLPFTPYSNFTRTYFDEYNNRYSDTFRNYNRVDDGYGNIYARHPNIPFNPWCIMFLSNPVTLSISTTL